MFIVPAINGGVEVDGFAPSRDRLFNHPDIIIHLSDACDWPGRSKDHLCAVWRQDGIEVPVYSRERRYLWLLPSAILVLGEADDIKIKFKDAFTKKTGLAIGGKCPPEFIIPCADDPFSKDAGMVGGSVNAGGRSGPAA